MKQRLDDVSQGFILRYGSPDKALSTEHDSPRPAIPTRVFCYNSIGLTVIFIPEASQYDKPPYKWKLVSFVDQQTETPITADEALARFPE